MRDESEQKRGHIFQGFGMKIEAFLGMVFKVLFIVSGSYGTICTADYGHGKRGMEDVVQQYNFGMKNEAYLCGTDLVL
jgi:hypothetical protein